VADFRVDSVEAVLALSLDDAAVDGFTFFTGPVDDECPEPDGFFSDLVVDTSALATSGSVPSPATEPDGVVSVTDPDGVVPVAPATELDGVVPVAPATELDGVVPLAPATEPDAVEVEPDVFDASEAGVAHATPTELEREIADPMPKATANAPTRPM
jgi:hypothetical protein